MKTQLKFLAVTAAMLFAHCAMAQSADTWMARIGVTTISPQVNSGNLSAPSFANSKTDVGSATALSGLGQIGDVQALPVTAFVQYRFMEANSAFRPYVGLGVTYAYFFNARGSAALTALTNPGGPPTGIKVDSKWALTPQIGFSLAVDDKWFVDVFYNRTNLSTTTKLSTGQTVDLALDPNSYGLTVGYKF